MKRIIFPVLASAAIALTLIACQQKKANEPAKTEDIKSEVQITQELKDELIDIFEKYQQSEYGFFKMLPEGKDVELNMPDSVYLPLNFAEKAQTLDQKYFLLGMYLNDVLGKRYFLRIHDEEKIKTVAKLAVETNMPTLAGTDWEQVIKKTWDEFQNQKAEQLLADFKTALENGTADKFIQIATGAYMEAKYSQNVSRITMGELGNSLPPVWKVHADLEKGIVELYDKMLPFYPSLEATQPLINDMRVLHKEMTDEEIKVVYSQYLDRIIARRAAFLAQLQ